MKGVGEIITNDRSLLERVFENILYVFNKRWQKILKINQCAKTGRIPKSLKRVGIKN
jgi:hypothetical protein